MPIRLLCLMLARHGAALAPSLAARKRTYPPRDYRPPRTDSGPQQIRNLLMDLGDRAADFRGLVRDEQAAAAPALSPGSAGSV